MASRREEQLRREVGRVESQDRRPPPSHARLHPQRHCFGVTLTEVVVAAALLLVCVVPLLKALTLARIQDRAIEHRSWSLMLAQRELEWVRARCLRDYDACYRAGSQALGEGYLGTVADEQERDLRTVTVSVGWDRNGDGVLAAGEVEVNLTARLARP